MQSGPLIVRTPFIKVVERAPDVTEVVDETVTYTITPNPAPVAPPVETKVCTIKEGDHVTLRISSPTPVTLADVQLLKNGQPIPNDQETRKHLQLEQNGPKDIRLSVKDARLSDTGEYSALIHSIAQPIIQLDVQPREMQIQMIDLPQDTFLETETLTIDCQFPQPNLNGDYRWYKDNQLLLPSDRIEITKDSIHDSLVIHQLRLSDAGVYELKNSKNILRTPPIKILPREITPNVEAIRPQVASKLVHEGKNSFLLLLPLTSLSLSR